MKKHIFTKDGLTLIRTVEAKPVCMEDFCDSCGDCLHCYTEDDCGGEEGREHFWVQYGEEEGKEGG